MSVVGVIAEFNPFHSGHEFLLNQARLVAKSDPIIVIMSGNYVQRGDVALLDKWERAKVALASGADLVFELPFNYAVQPADIFASGGIKLLASLGVTDLVFGAEDENLNFQELGDKIANITEHNIDFSDYTKTYATQYNQMVTDEVGYEVNQPNLMLAVAYAVANTKLGHPLQLHPIRRIGQAHEAELVDDELVMSSTSIRNFILHVGATERLNDWLPPVEVMAVNNAKSFPTWLMMFDYLRYRLDSSTPKELARIYQMSEGLQYKMKAEIIDHHDFTSFLRAIKSKRYTYSRLRRTCLYTLLNVAEEEMATAQSTPYLFLLGYTNLGSKYLKRQRKEFTLPIYSRVDAKLANGGPMDLQVRVDRFYEQLTMSNQNFGRRPNEVK